MIFFVGWTEEFCSQHLPQIGVLGCVCFGFKLISEMLFRKIGCLIGPENWVKLKMFSVLTIK